MQTLRIVTNQKPVSVFVTVEATNPCNLKLQAVDEYHYNSVYANINQGWDNDKFKGRKEFEIKLPLSPKSLLLRVWCSKGDRNVKVTRVRLAPLPLKQIPNLTPELVDFIRYAGKFAQQAGYLPTRRRPYMSKSGRVVIYYFDQLLENGRPSKTPARVERRTGNIEVNAQMFRNYSIPMRMYILLHEKGHNYLRTTDEFEADDFALKIYEALGFPRIEAVYSFTKVFHNPMTPEQKQRAEVTLNKMVGYKNGY